MNSILALMKVLNALMGFSEHVSGTVRYDGKMIEDLDIGKIRNDIQIIRLDQYFIGTVWENLVGFSQDKKFTLTEVYAVLEKLGLLENILSLPDQLNTVIKPQGFPFSRSQLLTLQIAKALLLKPRILFVTT